jgi:MFS family permease
MSASTLSPARSTDRGLSRSYWYLWWAALISGAGDGVRSGALPLVAAALSRRPEAVASVWFAGGLPFVLVGPFTGVLTDRWRDRRRVLRSCDLVSAVLVTVFAALVAAGAADIALLVGLNFLLGSVQTLRDNAALAVIPEVVPVERLDTANSRVQGAQMLTIDLLGPPSGALLVALPAGMPFLLDSASFAAAAVLVSGLAASSAAVTAAARSARRRAKAVAVAEMDAPARSAEPAAAPGRGSAGILAEVADGLRWLWRHRLLRTLCLLVGVSGMAVTAVVSIAVLYALQILHVGRDMYAVLLAVVATGGVAGALLAPVLSARLGRGPVLRIAFALAPPAFLAAAVTSDPLVAALALTGVGAAVGLTNVVTVSLRQSLVPAELQGRVNASYRLVAVGLTPVGAVLGGVLGDLFGLRTPFFAGAVLFTVGLLVALRLDTGS